jgi:hypothetical protein
VSPDSTIRVTFSEPIRADQISNSYLQLVPADGTGQVIATFDPPVIANDGTFVVTMRPPPAATLGDAAAVPPRRRDLRG